MRSRPERSSTRWTTSTACSSSTGLPARTRSTPAASTSEHYPRAGGPAAPVAQLAEAPALKAGSYVGSTPTGGTRSGDRCPGDRVTSGISGTASGNERVPHAVMVVGRDLPPPCGPEALEGLLMESRNPVFSRSDAFSRRGYATFNETPTASAGALEEMYNAPTATGVQTGRMTMDDVVIKTGLMFAVLVPLAAVNFVLKNPVLTFGGAIAGLVIALVISFKQSTNPALMLTYAGLEGLFVGGISGVYEDFYDGIVAQAVLGTLAVFSVALWAYKSGRVRATPKFQRGVMIALGG